MKRFTFGLCAAATLAAATAANAQSDLRTLKYSKAGVWQVSALYKGPRFLTCYANAKYKSGISVTLLAYADGMWKLQFYKNTWAKRPVSEFPVTVEVDGRTILNGNGRYRGRNVFIDLGRSADRVRAIMKGRILGIRSASGTSRFQLTGSFQAAKQVARCWTYHKDRAGSQPGGNNGAFGGPANPGNNGAFGAPAAPRNNGAFGQGASSNRNNGTQAYNSKGAAPKAPARSQMLTRSQTLEYALRYLSKAPQRYEILPSNRNFFRHFPVNWRYAGGQIGGMMVLTQTQANAEEGIKILLGDQTKNCTGRSATQRRPTETTRNGTKIARATGVCEGNDGVASLNYTAVELSNNSLALIIETKFARNGQRQAPARPTPQNRRPTQPPGANDAVFPAPPSDVAL